MMHFIKCILLILLLVLLGLRNKQAADDSVPSTDVIEMFKEYIGSVDPDITQQNILKEEINVQKE